MKKIILSAIALSLIAFGIQSCKKDNNTLTTSEATEITATSQDYSDSETLVEDVEDETDLEIELRDGDCPTLTWANPEGTFPNTLTVDYGTEGCVGPHGHVRKGQIIINQSAEMMTAGATRTITFEDFYVDDIHLEGVKTKTNNGLNASGQPSFSKTLVGGKATWPDNTVATLDFSHTITMVEGFGTQTILDDVFSRTGSANGIGKNGNIFSIEITEPIIKRVTCPWPISGIVDITKNDKTGIIDFGFGENVGTGCDKKALLTLPNGTTKVITLHGF